MPAACVCKTISPNRRLHTGDHLTTIRVAGGIRALCAARPPVYLGTLCSASTTRVDFSMLTLVTEKRKLLLLLLLRSRKLQTFADPAKPKPRPLLLSISHNSQPKRHLMVVMPLLENKENYKQKRLLTVYKGKIQSPSSERTLATLSPEASDIGSLDTVSMDGVSPTLSTHDEPDYTAGFADYHSYLAYDEPFGRNRLHRTTNLSNISEFMASDSGLPLGNRKLLEFEAREIQQLHARMFQEQEGDLTMRLVENALFMSFYEASEARRVQQSVRYWDDIDMNELFHLDGEDELVL